MLTQSILVLVIIGISGLATRHFFKKRFIEQTRTLLVDAAHVLSDDLRSVESTTDLSGWCSRHKLDSSLRVMVFGEDGQLVCDGHLGAQKIEASVIARMSGLSEQYSVVLHDDTLFVSHWIADRALVLRAGVRLTQLKESLRVLDTAMAVFLVLIAATLGSFAVWSGRMLVFPIGRLLVKTQNVLQNAGGEGAQSGLLGPMDALRDEGFGEWSELESSIDDIRKDLMAKAESLNVEREELATLMAAISDAILAVDLEGKPLFFNSRFALIFGNQEALSARNVRLWEMFRVPEILEAFKSALDSGKTGGVKAVSFEKEGDSKRFFSVSVSPLRKQSGEIYGAVGIFHDVTDLKGAEQIRIDFVANVSHELRTPLTSIKGYTDTLLIDVQDGRPVTKEFLDIISRNVDRLMNLIRDLLDLSSLESTDVLHKTSISAAEITSRVVRQLQGAFESKKQKVTEEVSAALVMADSRRVEQVLVNLLENANKYTPAGGEIKVRWESERSAVLLRVSDNGPGIPPEHHARLFERFYRVDKARSREQGGTGLGLSIVKHIMQRHDGTVWIESQPGQGSSFVCRFPA